MFPSLSETLFRQPESLMNKVQRTADLQHTLSAKDKQMYVALEAWDSEVICYLACSYWYELELGKTVLWDLHILKYYLKRQVHANHTSKDV